LRTNRDFSPDSMRKSYTARYLQTLSAIT